MSFNVSAYELDFKSKSCEISSTIFEEHETSMFSPIFTVTVLDKRTKRRFLHKLSSKLVPIAPAQDVDTPMDAYFKGGKSIYIESSKRFVNFDKNLMFGSQHYIQTPLYEFKFTIYIRFCHASVSESSNDSLIFVKTGLTFDNTDAFKYYEVLLDEINILDLQVYLKQYSELNRVTPKPPRYLLNYSLSKTLTMTGIAVTIVLAIVLSQYFSSLIIAGIIVAELLCLMNLHIKHLEVMKQSVRHFFMNGWNAWSFTGVCLQGSLPPIHSMPDSHCKYFHAGSQAIDINQRSRLSLFIDPAKPFIASDMFTAFSDDHSQGVVIIGFLTQHQQFGCIASNYANDRCWIAADGDQVLILPNVSIHTDWCMIHIQDRTVDDPFELYMDLTGYFNRLVIKEPESELDFSVLAKAQQHMVPVGWCSWYHFYDHISDRILVDNIHAMNNIRSDYNIPDFNLFQVDDGYQLAWGDWLTLDPKKFPYHQSLAPIISQIIESKFTPGVWMAPFSCDKHSSVAKNHPDWILQQSNRIPANTANCGKFFYAFDITIPEVQDYIRHNLLTVAKTWGCRYLKLDFLYSAAVRNASGCYANRSLTRAQIMQLGMKIIRESVGGEIFILGCGAPMGSVIGHVQANRVSADAGLTWNPAFPLPSWDRHNLPCGRNMMRNTICRMSMHKRWWINDPDCILLRTSTSFTDEEIIGIATVKGLCGGSFIVSDNLASIPSHRLRILQQLLPPTNISAVPIDLLSREMPEVLKLKLTLTAQVNSSSHLAEQEEDEEDKIATANLTWNMIGLCNWEDRVKDKSIALSQLVTSVPPFHSLNTAKLIIHVYDFWRSKYTCIAAEVEVGINSQSSIVYGRICVRAKDMVNEEHTFNDLSIEGNKAEKLVLRSIPIHGSRLLSCRTSSIHDRFVYLGSNKHFSCGLEVESIRPLSPSTYEIVFYPGYLKFEAWGSFICVYLACESSARYPITAVRCTGDLALVGISRKAQKICDINDQISGVMGSMWKIPVKKSEDEPVEHRNLVLSW
jgi:hypothetical protein